MKIPGLFGICFLSVIGGCASTPEIAKQPVVTPSDAHELCYAYIYGDGGSPDYQNARYWCEVAAKTGESSSETLYAELFYFGEGGTVDSEKAAYWYAKAAKQNHVHAEFMLFNLYVRDKYMNGKYSPRGVEMLQKSAASGYPKAIEALAKYKKRT